MEHDNPLRYRIILENLNDFVCEVDMDGRFVYVNQTYEELLGYQQEELIGKLASDYIDPREVDDAVSKYEELLENRQDSTEIWKVRHKDGSFLYLECKAKTYTTDTGEVRVVVISRDITQKKHLDFERIRALNDRSTLLKEMNHRVKNNLNIIISLISLSLGKSSNTETREILTDLSKRIYSIACIHNSLFTSQSFATVNIAEYLDKIIKNAISSMTITKTWVDFICNIPSINIDIQHATHIGLIINELTVNSIKHGFSDCEEGVVRVTITQKESLLIIHYDDNGSGLDDLSIIEQSMEGHIGFLLINSIITQLNGNYKAYNENGFHFIFSIDLEKKS